MNTDKQAVTDSRTVAGEPWKQADAQVIGKLLSDGSYVYDVQVTDGHDVIEIQAKSMYHASNCAREIRAAIAKAI